MAIPKQDSLLIPFASNWNSRLISSASTFGLDSEQSAQFTTLFTAYTTAYTAMTNARAAGNRSESLTTNRTVARDALLAYARMLYTTVQANTTVSDSNKQLLGIVIKKTRPSPKPVPIVAPRLEVTNANGRTFSLRASDPTVIGKLARPKDAAGMTVFLLVAETPSLNPADWTFATSTSAMTADVTVDPATPAGSRVWFAAFFFNARAESGPMCAPVGSYVQFGGGVQGAEANRRAA